MEGVQKLLTEVAGGVVGFLYKKDKPVSSAIKTITLFMVLHNSIKLYRAILWRRRMAKLFPGPKYDPIMGNLKDMEPYGGFTLAFFKAVHEKYGKCVAIWLGPFALHLSIDHPEDIQVVHKLATERPDGTYKIVNYLGKENILFVHGAWQKLMRRSYQRIVNAPEVHSKLQEQAFDDLQKEISTWDGAPGGVNAADRFAPVVYNVMGKVLFGSQWARVGQQVMDDHMFCVHNSMKWALLPWSPWWNADYRAYEKAKAGFWSGVERLLDNRRKEIAAGNIDSSDKNNAINLLLTEKKDDGSIFYDKRTAVSTMLVFMNGAFDTTLNTVVWILYFLAQNPEVQKRLRAEVEQNFPELKKGKIADMKELMNLKYLDSVIREGMRYVAAAPINMRLNMEEDYQLPGIGTIPKDVPVILNYELAMHKKDVFGQDSDKFDPERFEGDSEEIQKRKRMWTPFGDHTRMCAGRNFALVELRLFLSTIITRFDIELVNPGQKVTQKYEAGINVTDPKPMFYFKARK